MNQIIIQDIPNDTNISNDPIDDFIESDIEDFKYDSDENTKPPNVKCAIYMFTFPNGKRYIGQTNRTINERWREHRIESHKVPPRRNAILYNAIRKYGWNNIKKEILYQCSNESELDKIEVELTLKYNTLHPNGYNMVLGGQGNKIASEQTKKNIGEKVKETYNKPGKRARHSLSMKNRKTYRRNKNSFGIDLPHGVYSLKTNDTCKKGYATRHPLGNNKFINKKFKVGKYASEKDACIAALFYSVKLNMQDLLNGINKIIDSAKDIGKDIGELKKKINNIEHMLYNSDEIQNAGPET
jgi:group I intron endonuclease